MSQKYVLINDRSGKAVYYNVEGFKEPDVLVEGQIHYGPHWYGTSDIYQATQLSSQQATALNQTLVSQGADDWAIVLFDNALCGEIMFS